MVRRLFGALLVAPLLLAAALAMPAESLAAGPTSSAGTADATPTPTSVSAVFAYPAGTAPTSTTTTQNAIRWTESGPVASRSLREDYGQAGRPDCANVAWKTAWTQSAPANPTRLAGFLRGYCYRWVLKVTSATGSSVTVTSAPLYVVPNATYTKNVYSGSWVRYQDPDRTACTAATTLMILNFISTVGSGGGGFRWTKTTSYTAQENILAWERGHMTMVTYHAGSDPHGWRNALNFYGWNDYANPATMHYQDVAYPSYAIAVKAAVTAMAKYNKPVAILGWAGGHAFILNGYSVYGQNPAISSEFTVNLVYLTDPLAGDAMRNRPVSNYNFQNGPATYRFRPYAWTDSPYDDPYMPGTALSYREWYGRWVMVVPVR